MAASGIGGKPIVELALDAAEESLKTCVRGCFHMTARAWDGAAALALSILWKSDYSREHNNQRELRSRGDSLGVLVEEDTGLLSRSSDAAPEKRRWIFSTPDASWGKAAPSERTSGVFEDLQVAILARIDVLGARARRALLTRCAEDAKDESIPPSVPFVDLEALDKRGVAELATESGYGYEKYEVTTSDGYVLALERIPRKGASKCLYLQHGVFDSSASWVGEGVGSGMAFSAHDAGYDVWLGTLRGNYGSLGHRDPEVEADAFRYWEFSLDEHAFNDVPAIIARIRAVKRTERFSQHAEQESAQGAGCEEDPRISIVAHSLGAAATLMYVLRMRELGEVHHTEQLVLLCPAGVHVEIPLLCRITGPIIDLFAPYVPCFSVGYFSPRMAAVLAKLLQDARVFPGLRDFASFLLRELLGGRRDLRRHPFATFDRLMLNFLRCGTSSKLYRHFRQIYTKGRFATFDYGSAERNIEHWGCPQPIEWLSRYKMFDCPPVDPRTFL